MINLDLNSIQTFLKNSGVDVKHQEETNQLYFLLKIDKVEYPVFIRIIKESEFVQLIAFIPSTFKPETLSDTARLLHFLNKEIDIPGFGMDESSAVVFFRCMVPVKNNKLETKQLTAYLNAIEFISTSFSPVVASVAQGKMTFNEVVEKAKSQGAIN